MTPACGELFQYALRHVTPQDVLDYCPADPGYPGYVREFTAILSSRVPPSESNFEITETIGLTRWGDANGETDPVRFRRFRTFANAVGVVLATGPQSLGDVEPSNYFAISLLDDAYALQDSRLLHLLAPVFAELHRRIAEYEWDFFDDEAPFLVLGQLVLAFLGYAPQADVGRLCEQLVAEASKHAGNASPEFLWGCTVYDQLHERWKHFVELSFPSDGVDESIASLRRRLLARGAGAA